MANGDFEALLGQFRRTLDDCREFYRSSAQACIDQHCLPADYSPEQFLALMDDLHKGLIVKVFVAVGTADSRWSREEQFIAALIFKHLWGRGLSYDQLQSALQGVCDQAARLSWYSLIRFYDRLPPLRDRVAELNTIVTRMANIIAKSDGTVAMEEESALRLIQRELDQLKRLSVDEDLLGDASPPAGKAIQDTREETRAWRTQVHREQPSPAPAAAPPAAPADSPKSLDAAREEMKRLIGLQNVKREIDTLANYLQLKQHRESAGLPELKLSLHQVFAGNPGTGKTTVARIMGQLLGALGILGSGHLVETDRSGLVAEYAGQTGPKTNKKIDEALDGILFIDEAYSLVSEDGDDAFGREALQALLKRMEDDRDRLVVILAGYPEPMDRLLKSNPGLSSRFNNRFVFEDYGPAELGQIFGFLCARNHFELDAEVRAKLLLAFQWLFDHRDEHFGNGRTVRNSFEQAVRRLANRIVGSTPVTTELLTQLRCEDIEFPEIPPEVFENLDQRRFAVACPGCGSQSKVPTRFLSRRVQCNKCKHRFVAEWGDPCE